MPIAIVPVVVPPSGDGPVANISALVGKKTVTLTGFFQGVYTLLASHNNVNFVPVLIFNSDGQESIKLTLPDAYFSVRVRAGANVVPGGSVAVEVAGVTKAGENQFATLATFPPGSGGTGPVIDTTLLFAPTGLESGINFICEGGLTGTVSVEGSNDGVGWGGIGTFQAGERQRPLLGLQQVLEFSPLSTGDNTRYLRFTVDGQLDTPLVLTIGGRIPATLFASGALVLDEEEGRAVIEVASAPAPSVAAPVFAPRVAAKSAPKAAPRATPNFSPHAGPNFGTEVILYEWEAPTASLPGAVTLELDAIVQVLPDTNAPTAVFRVYVGATNPGDTTGATLVLTTPNITSNVEIGIAVTGLPFANPGLRALVQITGQIDVPAQGNPTNEGDIRGVVVTIG